MKEKSTMRVKKFISLEDWQNINILIQTKQLK